MTQSSPPRHAVVIGAGLAGLLAAAVLREHMTVTVIDADVLPDGPAPRRGLPQARHVHLLWSGGARAIEEILPGITAQWRAAGALRRSLPTDVVTLTAQGWLPRHEEMQFTVSCSRDLLDSVVRARVTGLDGVSTLQRSRVRSLEGSAARVTGVRVDTPGEEGRLIGADLVVDASGRGSRARTWLRELGVGVIRQAEVDSGLVYASRIFEAPAGAHAAGFPIVNVQSDARVPVPGQTATIVPIENGQWQATLSGTRGGQPTADPEAFVPFAKGARSPIVGELLEGRKPLTDVAVTQGTANRRLYFEKAGLPDGFFAVGDSVATFNPLYGQGMTVAAQGLLAVRALLRAKGLSHPGIGREAQRALAPRVATAWELATSQDILYPGATGVRPKRGSGVLGSYVGRLMAGATTDRALAAALLRVMTMNSAPTHWLTPAVIWHVLRATDRNALTAAPLTAAERAAAGLTAAPQPL
ncbi:MULTISPECIES: NAD(P)/FAD-dependent oxidoreductase [unclassified Streptomyces]|uniref:NAD(P)/FAD-dependent oxidoreductase n=1 Tax=unclassified Streptomyces TaxID=2593676 RepID=UPI00224F5C92|nr:MULTISPECIES: FAD-dependent monooxygenase [unclassified Streptomyces]MCX4528926.1 FAD-dependent monooxygenase [Streptomyces sp. NBC_01551]MCX4540403.1 FAD-dependent monooxygenase [Streptomyces sp. NBC_01565]